LFETRAVLSSLLSTPSLGITGSGRCPDGLASRVALSPFNSLSRDHERIIAGYASVEIMDSHFQLPLSGSQVPAHPASSSAFSFNSLSRDHRSCHSPRSAYRAEDLSTPSLGITRSGEPREETRQADFQLPLSGSQVSSTRGKRCGPCPTFNSLSRDHALNIRTKEPPEETFNSLSRDHWPSAPSAPEFIGSIFQLPLSGSR
jgi:hypothetical protein